MFVRLYFSIIVQEKQFGEEIVNRLNLWVFISGLNMMFLNGSQIIM